MLVDCITDTIHHTPLVRLNALNQGDTARIAVKQESRLPGGSIKDRVGLALIEDAEAKGLIHPERTLLIEPSSGNSGIALAMVSAVKGYRLRIIMPETCSLERRVILKAYGAELHLTPAHLGMQGACDEAKRLSQTLAHAYLLDQFSNPANAGIHERTTGPEIWTDTEGEVDIFIASVGTGGTLTGVARYLKAQNPAVQIIAVEPSESAVLSGQSAGAHLIQGIGTGFIPPALDVSLIDEIITVDSQTAIETAKALALKEGMLSGISSGANVAVALQVAKRPENRGKLIVTIQCSNGERYLSSPLFQELSQACQAMTAI
jgi:cysteine synthase A